VTGVQTCALPISAEISSIDSTVLRKNLTIMADWYAPDTKSLPFTYYEIELPKPNNSAGWVNATSTFSGSGLQLREWYKITQVGFYLDDDAGELMWRVIVDGIHFKANLPFSGKYPTVDPTFVRQFAYNDVGLKSNTDCQNMAQNLYTGLNIKQYSGICEMRGVRRDFTLKPGYTIQVVIPSAGVNIQTGQTPALLGIQTITYRPNTEIVTVGKIYSKDELISQIIRATRLHAKTD